MSKPNKDIITASTATNKTLVIPDKPSGFDAIDGFVNNAADQDWIRVELRAGELYELRVNKNASSVDPTLTLRGQSGEFITSNDDGGPGNNALLTLRVETTGTYFLDVGGFGTTEGAYTVSAREVSATVNTQSTIGMGSAITGNIQGPRDQDWHRVTLEAGKSYIFDVGGGGLSDATLALRDADGAQLAFNDDGGPGSAARVEFFAASGGTYFLDVGGFGGSAGGYTLAARQDDVADDIFTVDVLASDDQTRWGRIETAADQDFWKVELVAGNDYIFDAAYDAQFPFKLDTTLALRNSTGALIEFDDDGGKDAAARIEFTATTSGTYFLDVGGFANNTGQYRLGIEVDDVANDADTSDSIVVGGSRTGDIEEFGDNDVFSVNLVAGEDYVFSVNGGTLADPRLGLRDAEFDQLIADDDSGPGLDPVFAWTATYTGEHFLSVSSAGGSVSGTYILFA